MKHLVRFDAHPDDEARYVAVQLGLALRRHDVTAIPLYYVEGSRRSLDFFLECYVGGHVITEA